MTKKRDADVDLIQRTVDDIHSMLPKDQPLAWYGLVLMRVFYEVSQRYDESEAEELYAMAAKIMTRDRRQA